MEKLCGIDEAGRGPMAGDLVVVGCILHTNIAGLNDSKKLTQSKREALFTQIKDNATYTIITHSAHQIDRYGLSYCLQSSLQQIKNNLQATRYLFDGNRNFGVLDIETMVKADSKIAEVSAASILAKVTRDRSMIEASKLYPLYEFHKHKGYITKRHVELVKKYGYSPIHRKSYKVKALQQTLF